MKVICWKSYRVSSMVDWTLRFGAVLLFVTFVERCHCVGIAEKQYPGVVDFLVDFTNFYQYNEIYIVIHQKDLRLLEYVARSLLRGEVEATTVVIRSYQKKYGSSRGLPFESLLYQELSRPDFSPVAITRRPIFITTIANVLDLEGEFEGTIGEASRAHPWLVLCGDSVPIFTDEYYYPLDNLLSVASWRIRESEQPVKVDIWEAYQPGRKFPLRKSVVGFWQNTSSLIGSYSEPSAAGSPGGKTSKNVKPKRGAYSFPDANFASRRTDLSGLHIRCLTESWQPFTDNSAGKNDDIIIGGIMGDSFKLMSKILNFTYSCRQAPDRQFGNKENDSWTGMVGELIMDNGDVIIAPLDDTYQRAQEIDFVVATGTITYDMIIRRPEPQTMTNFSRVLQPKSWQAYVLSIVVTCLLYAHFVLFGGKEGFVAIFDATFDIITVYLCQVTSCIKTPRISRRIFLLTAVMTAWTVVVYYMADLVAFLAIPDTDPVFNNMAGLLEYKESYKLGLQKGNSEVERFRNATDVTLKRVWNEIILKDPANILPTAEEGFRRVLEEKFVFLTDEKYFRYHNSDNCSFMPVGMKLFQYGVGMAVQKDSPLRYVLNYQVLQQQSSGIMNRFKDRYNPKFDSCITAATGPLSLTTLASAFIIVIIGLVISLCFMIGERSCNNVQDTEYKLFSPEDRRLMTAPFEDGLRALGYIYDKEKGLLFRNLWPERDLVALLTAYKSVRPKLFSILDTNRAMWRKVGIIMNKHPKLCERKFNDLVIRYEENRGDASREAMRWRDAVYYQMLQDIVENDPAQALKNVVPDAGILNPDLDNNGPDSISNSIPNDNDQSVQKSSAASSVGTSTEPVLPGDKRASSNTSHARH